MTGPGDLFAGGGSSHEGYTEIFVAYLVGRTSSREKHLEDFSKFVSKVFGGLPWRLAHDLTQSRKTRVLHF